MDSWREKVVAEAITWIGTPYHPQARIKGPRGGVDCGMLLIEVFKRTGLSPDIDPGNYAPEWHLHRGEEMYLGWIAEHCAEVSVALGQPPPLPGDVAVYKFGRCYAHGAIVVAWPLLVHAHLPDGQVAYGDGEQNPLVERDVKFFSWGAKHGR